MAAVSGNNPDMTVFFKISVKVRTIYAKEIERRCRYI